ncbi:hypothetical protein HG535_0E02950 [Zygotorulaspora mrakii]|uniref:Uncharacterized protein n=1 Tax=Zygotorulaspora mrakii TaxID=42260 RepID=A0A7H9B3H6_ZYGMR|nr:uncharacterized protein HG535_0E02950 [Zygotorulaspora mrakii]QLG73211.1 hypothetical protein HG535_0E02950 [Zygotorulaspora mrakii]
MNKKTSILPKGNTQQAHDEPTMQNARLRLDYKKSFQDDLLFFPENKVFKQDTYIGYNNAYMSSKGVNNPVDSPHNQAASSLRLNPYAHQQSQHKENLASLLVLKNLEKQQQHQQQQEQIYAQSHLPSQTFSFKRGGQTYYSQSQHLPHYGDQNQNVNSYVNMRVRN